MEAEILSKVLAGIDEACIVYSPDFTIHSFNKRAEDMFRIPAAEIIGKSFSIDMAKVLGREAFGQVMYPSIAPSAARLSEPGADPAVMRIAFAEGEREFITTTFSFASGFVKLVREVTREELLARSKGDFITIAAHQLRTPATAANWALESLASDTSLPSAASGLARTGHAASQALLSIITRLLDAAQIEDGRFGVDPRPGDLSAFLGESLSHIMPYAKSLGVSLYFERQSAPVIALFDASRLGMAVQNIVDNAIKYSGPEGRVTVTLSSSDGFAEVSVADTGPGIPDEDMPQIFGKFFRGSDARRAVTEGSGLGLYLAKNIIEAHHGRIWAESAEGRGSVFHFTVPRA